MTTLKQDLAPPGGYAKIPFKRVPARVYFNGYQMILGYLGMTAGAAYLYYLNQLEVERFTVENRSGRFAVMPLLLAERDRAFLKQLRKNRDDEAKLMKDVPGWVVGTWYGEPVFKTVPKGTLDTPSWHAFCVHAPAKDFENRSDFHLWN